MEQSTGAAIQCSPNFYQSDTWLYANARAVWWWWPNNHYNIMVMQEIMPASYSSALQQAYQYWIIISVFHGDRNPQIFTVGFVNNMSYQKFKFSFLWDLKVGGDIFNANRQISYHNGQKHAYYWQGWTQVMMVYYKMVWKTPALLLKIILLLRHIIISRITPPCLKKSSLKKILTGLPERYHSLLLINVKKYESHQITGFYYN